MVRKLLIGWLVLSACALCACGDDDDADASSAGTGASGSGGSAGKDAGTAGKDGGTAGRSDGSAGSGFEPGSPTFSAIYREIFVNTGCNGGPLCHGAGSATGGLVMNDKDETYSLLVNQHANGTNLTPGGTSCKDTDWVRVVPGDPDASLLVNKVEESMPVCGQGMPPGSKISDEQIQQIRTWIEMGAKND